MVERSVWDSYMVMNKVTDQWDTITGSYAEARVRAKRLGPEWKVIAVVIREVKKKARVS